MALTDSNMGPADIAAVMGNNGFGGFGGWGSDFWLIIILLFAFGGFGGYGGGFGGGMWGMDGLYPWMNNAQITTNGFQNQATNQAINSLQNSVTSGFGDVQLGIAGINQNLCQTGNGITQAVNNGFSQAEISNNARQIANMQQSFNAQTATTGAINGVQSSIAAASSAAGLANCQLGNTVQNEANATRFADANNTRDIITNQTANTQAILDKLCQLELDGVRNQLAQAERENVGLQNQLNMATLRESQTAQNAFIQQGLTNEVDALYDRLKNCPVGCVPVYGSQPIFSCNNGYAYGTV